MCPTCMFPKEAHSTPGSGLYRLRKALFAWMPYPNAGIKTFFFLVKHIVLHLPLWPFLSVWFARVQCIRIIAPVFTRKLLPQIIDTIPNSGSNRPQVEWMTHGGNYQEFWDKGKDNETSLCKWVLYTLIDCQIFIWTALEFSGKCNYFSKEFMSVSFCLWWR